MNDPRDWRRGSAESQGQNDLKMVGCGIVVLGGLGFLGAIVAIVGGRAGDEALIPVALGGGLLLVLAGCMVAAFGIRGKPGTRGWGSVALTIGLGILLFAAAFGFLFVTCFAIVMTSLNGMKFH